MHLRFQEYDDFLIFNKPFAIRTHKVSENQFGFVEYLAEKLKQPLWVVHRLDKETSGLILFAKTREAATQLSELFEKQSIKKTYLFLTDVKSSQTQFNIKSHIDKQSEFFVNVEGLADNSETDFQYVSTSGNFQLWRALPKTGKPHQIRLHAQKAGIPILGDNQHGGSIHHRLALHAQKIEFHWNGKIIVAENAPPSFLSIFEDCYYSRHSLFEIPPAESYRLIHTEQNQLRADIYDSRLWVYDYSEAGLSPEEKTQIQNFAGSKNLILQLRHMLDRGKGVGGLEKKTLESDNNENWVAEEECVRYSLRTDSGFSPGLFLDQRENRQWVRLNSSGKNVLNLFSYTSGFSVQAALGKAATVTTVDVSAKFLEWSRDNFKLNNLEPSAFEFFSQDTILFLKGSIKRGRKWDLIICDPPSFGRSKDSVWKIERDLPDLAEQLLQCLAPAGQILFTCNLEKKSRDELIQLFTKKIKNKKFKLQRLPMQSLDFELTDDLNNLMKGFLLSL